MAHELLTGVVTIILAEKPLNVIEPEIAKAAALRYVSGDEPGIRRERNGKSFVYLDAQGRKLTDADDLLRIKALAIPPAWGDVWICPRENGHLQATGRDAKRRKQYRYHKRWREVRDENKYDRLLAFAVGLPKLRRRLRRDLKAQGLPRDKVLATVVSLLESTLIRVGNEEYARNNKSFGLTTMRDRHVKPSNQGLRFEFKGKGNVAHTISVADPHLAKIVKRCRDLPGYTLFQYIDEQGEKRSIEAADVNEYLREAMRGDFTAKDFRTWAGTVLAYGALNQLNYFQSQSQAKKNILSAIESVAKKLGNTKTVCRNCYIHPEVIEAYLERDLQGRAACTSLRGDEASVAALLKRRGKNGDKLARALKKSVARVRGKSA
ncbi:MAG: DNA topoisomerase IB [Burkholderiales bacterium]